jgi:hypothetical protein
VTHETAFALCNRSKAKKRIKELCVGLALILLAGIAMATPAQEKPKAAEGAPASFKPVVPLKVTLIFSEYDGDKKVLSLPYSFVVNADEHGSRQTTRVRSGMRIPIATGSVQSGGSNPSVNTQIQYLDIGTNLDCSGQPEDDGRYKLNFSVDRSSLALPGQTSSDKPEETIRGDASSVQDPPVRQFRTDFSVSLKDGQTVETVVATDPLSGHITRISVTATLVK